MPNPIPTHPRSRRPRPAGFTLLELIVAMAIVSILVASLYVSLRNAFRAKASAEAAVEPPHTAEIVLDWIGQDLKNALSPTGTLAGASIFTGTAGVDDRGRDGSDVLFYGTTDAPRHGAGDGDMKQIELHVITGPNGTDHLLVRQVVNNLLAVTAPTPDTEVICRGVGGFDVQYFDGTNWVASWDSTQEDNNIPVAVQVTLTLDRDNGNSVNKDGSRCFRFVRIYPLSCSNAANDTNLNSGAL